MLAGLLGLSAWAPADAARHGVPLQGTVTAT
jgi:hypothetical protein